MKNVIKKMVWALVLFGNRIVSTFAMLMKIIGLMFELIGTAFRLAYEWLHKASCRMIGKEPTKSKRT